MVKQSKHLVIRKNLQQIMKKPIGLGKIILLAKSWQCGGATIKGDGVDAYFQYFEITHNFLVIPYYIEGEYNDLIAGIKPYNFDNTNSLKYISNFEALYFRTDPNKKQIGSFVSNKGNVGWFDENFNTDLTNYSHTAIVHKTPTNITLPSVEISQNLNTFTFDVKVLLYGLCCIGIIYLITK